MSKMANSLVGYMALLRQLVFFVRLGRRSLDIKKPYGSEKAHPLFGMNCESIDIIKKYRPVQCPIKPAQLCKKGTLP